MTATRFEMDGDQRTIPDHVLNLIMEDRLASAGFVWLGGSTRDGFGVFDQQVPKGAGVFRVSVDDREILLIDHVTSKLLAQEGRRRR